MEQAIKEYIDKYYKHRRGQIADAAGISRGFMSDWMNNKRGISVQNFEALCKVIGIVWRPERPIGGINGRA
jgi:transcriptional regulator with XRE-family HTH domain